MIRRVGLALGAGLGLVLLLIGAAFALAQTGPGQRVLQVSLERALSWPGTTVEIDGLRGLVPFDLRLARLGFANAEGLRFEIADLHLAWSPAALLRGRIEIPALTAERIRLDHLSGRDEPLRLPELPSSLPPIVVERLAAPQIELGPDVLGQPATFSLAGHLAGSGDGRALVLGLEARRIDQPTASASLDGRLNLDPAALQLTLDATETGGLLARLSGRPDAGGFTLHLAGSGPLGAWSGDLRLELERLARADARLKITFAQQPELRLDGNLQPAPGLWPAQIAALVGERLGLRMTVIKPAAQRLNLQDLRLATASGELSGQAEIDLDRHQLSATADLQLPALARFAPLLATPLTGALNAHLTAQGALLQPKGRLVLTVDGPQAGQIAARQLRTTLDFAMPKPATVQVSGTGRLTALQPPPDVPIPTQDMSWRLVLAGSAGGPLTISELAVSARDLSLDASGTIDPAILAGHAKLALAAPALGPLIASFGQHLDGSAQLTADLGIGEGGRRIEVDLSGALNNLAGLPPGAAELLGSEPSLRAQATLEPGRRLEVEGLTITGGAATLGGILSLALPEQTLGGKVTLALPKLAVLAPAAGRDLAGALEITVVPGGSLGAPTALVQARGRDLLLEGHPIGTVALEASAKDLLLAPNGKLEIAAQQSGLEARLATGFRVEERQLHLRDLQLTGPRTRIGGDLIVDLAHRLARGELTGEVGNLAAFAPLLPVQVSGQLKLQTRLDAAGERQSVALVVDGNQLRTDFGSLHGGHLRATVADALGTPTLEGNLDLDGYHQAQFALEHAALTAKGSASDLALTLTAEGKLPQAFKLDGRAGLGLGQPLRFRLEQLAGNVANAPLRLGQPAELTLDGAGYKLTRLDLRLGDARLTASADLGVSTVAADARLDGLPLALLTKFGAPTLSGNASAILRLQGAADDPRGTLELNAVGLRSDKLTFADLPPGDLTVRAEFAQQRLTIDARGRGVSKQPMTLSAALPLVVRFDTREFALPKDGRVSGRLNADLALARLAGLAGLDDQTLSGDLNLDLSLDGTVAAPGIRGAIGVTNGGYANGTTGTVLKAIALSARADGRKVVIERFSATDGGNGSLSGSGAVTIDPTANFPLSLQAQFKNARLVRRDDADATISGKVELQGDFAQLKLTGGLTVDRAEIRIPDSTGPKVAVIPVKEVGGRGRPFAPPAGGRSLGIALDLKFDLPGQVFVRGRGLESEWHGEFRATGSVDKPSLVGTLEITRGYVDFIEQRLNLTKGVINFGGASPPDPTVDIQARAQQANFTAIIEIQGRALDPKLTLTSQPPLPQDEVMSRLLFNRDSSSITPIQAAQLAFALERLNGGGLDVMGKLRSVLHVDTLDVTSNPDPNNGSATGDQTVRAGKYLNKDVYVEVQKGVAAQSGKARVQVQIAPGVSVQAETGENAQGGLGLQWRYDY